MTTAIQEYSKTDAALSDLAERFKGVVFAVATREGLDAARKARAELRTYRTDLERLRVEIKAPALERCRLIDSEAKRITAALVALEDPIDAQIKLEEERKEAERAEKARLEAERVARIQATIAAVWDDALAIVGKPSSVISDKIAETQGLVIGADFAEFSGDAEAVKQRALTKLAELHHAAVAHEAEQERIRKEREELARLRAEQEERQRQEAARIAVEARKRAEEEAAARRKIEEEERDARLRIEEQERKARAALEEEDRQARAVRAAEESRLKAERDRLEAGRRALEAQQRQERETAEARAKAERDAKEAEERERQRQENELLGGREMLVTFKKRFGHREEFSAVLKAIDLTLAPKRKKAA